MLGGILSNLCSLFSSERGINFMFFHPILGRFNFLLYRSISLPSNTISESHFFTGW